MVSQSVRLETCRGLTMTVNEHKYVDVNFGRERTARKSGLYQYDYGQILRVSDLELPEYVTVDFSITDTRGSTETRVGKTTDGCLEVQIPNELLKNSHVSVNTEYYMIYAYIYVSDETSGNTVYKVILQVKTRSKPSDIGTDPEGEKLLDEAVNAVNAAASRAETAEKNAKQYATNAKKASSEASESAENAKSDREAVEELKSEFDKAAESVLRTATDARNEAESWAHGHVGYPDRDKDNAMYYSEAAKQVATKNGYCRMEINENGHLILERTENIKDSLDFRLNEKGHLEVMME